MAIQAGQLFGNYQVIRLLGEGGFGEVYLVENPLIQRRAAVKVLHPALAQDAELVRRFLNEARAASAIRHPNIIDVLDAGGTPEGAPYILMEFLEGVSLQKRLADVGRVALPQVLDIARQAGSALAAAHAAGIVHRDLKPENLFLVPDQGAPGGERVKVLDFGIAKMKQGSGTGGTFRTQTGVIMGSPAYMSPEQCKNSADVDLRSDVYSFATILYEMLAGRTPHLAESGTEMLVMHLTATPPPLRGLAADVPVPTEAAIMRGLARARADRYDGIPAFLEALLGCVAADSTVASHAAAAMTSPADGASPKLHVERTIPLPAVTTFSRATGELAAEQNDELLAALDKPRRWPIFAVGGVVVAGLALFLLTRPAHDSPPRIAPVAQPATAVAPVQKETPQPSLAAVLPSKPDAGMPAAAVAGAPPVTKPEPAAEIPAPAMRRPRHEAKRELGTKVQTPRKPEKKPEDVAGF